MIIIYFIGYGKSGSVNFGDRDITEWDTTEGILYGIKIGEIRPAPKLGYIRGWVTIGGGYKRGMTVFICVMALLEDIFK